MRLLRKINYIRFLPGKLIGRTNNLLHGRPLNTGELGFNNINYQGERLKRDVDAVVGVIEVDEDNEQLLEFDGLDLRGMKSIDPPLPTITHRSLGRVTKVKNRPEFVPGNPHGGRGAVLRTMPRSLRKMKEASEETNDKV